MTITVIDMRHYQSSIFIVLTLLNISGCDSQNHPDPLLGTWKFYRYLQRHDPIEEISRVLYFDGYGLCKVYEDDTLRLRVNYSLHDVSFNSGYIKFSNFQPQEAIPDTSVIAGFIYKYIDEFDYTFAFMNNTQIVNYKTDTLIIGTPFISDGLLHQYIVVK